MGIKPGQLVQVITEVLALEPGTGTVLHREFRNAGLVSTGPRGRNAPDATPRDAARLLIGILSSGRPSGAVEGYRFYSQLQPDPQEIKIKPGGFDLFSFFGLDENHTLEDALTALLTVGAESLGTANPHRASEKLEELLRLPAVNVKLQESARQVTLWFDRSTVLYRDREFINFWRALDDQFDAALSAQDTNVIERALEERRRALEHFPDKCLRIERSFSGVEIWDIAAAIYGEI